MVMNLEGPEQIKQKMAEIERLRHLADEKKRESITLGQDNNEELDLDPVEDLHGGPEQLSEFSGQILNLEERIQRIEERNAELEDKLQIVQKRLKKALLWKKNLQNNVFNVVLPDNIREEVAEVVFGMVKQHIRESFAE